MWAFFPINSMYCWGHLRFMRRSKRGHLRSVMRNLISSSWPVPVHNACQGKQQRQVHKTPECLANLPHCNKPEEGIYLAENSKGENPRDCEVGASAEQVSSNLIHFAPAAFLLLISCRAKTVLSAKHRGKQAQCQIMILFFPYRLLIL